MKLFYPKSDASRPLGPLLSEARTVRKLTLEDASKGTRLSLEEIQGLENDKPLDPRRARIQAVTYLRFLAMNPSEFKDSLPSLPELMTKRDKLNTHGENSAFQAFESLLSMLAPMGKLALFIIVAVALLGSWGMVRQLSRVRSMPWVSYTYSVSKGSGE